ncbi:DUF998 domain-containing protein [Kribbella sp. NPDC049227]|uniref:DUF998 domain-containing protein n=1 Tax=Kribbella sp. NPDC049227 TaxID=3364113 RepID=UPI003711AE9C
MVTVPYRLMRNVMVAAGVLYCSLLLEAVAGYPLDVHQSFLSELGARDQATSPYARAMDLGAGVLVLTAAVLGRRAARIHRDVAGLLISSAVFGAGTLFDSLSPMNCAPSAGDDCRAAGSGLVLHEFTSTLAGLGSIAMGTFALLVLRRAAGVRERLVAVLAAAVVVTQAWLGIETSVEVLTGNDLHPPGILQRVSILLVCIFLGTVLPGVRHACSR